MRKRRLGLGLLAVLALVAASCGSSSDSNKTPTTKPAVVGGSVVVVGPDAQSLDPVKVINTATQGADVLQAVYDALYTLTPGTSEFNPRIATSFTTTDGLTWTLTLRNDVKFSDGTALDAEAVRFNWDRSKTNPRATSYGQLTNVESFTVTSPTVLTVKLKTVNRQFVQIPPVVNLNWIASPTAIKAQGDTYGADAKAVGAGPFTVKSRTPATETVVVRNATYWQAGLPKLDQMTFKAVVDTQAATDSVISGQAQLYTFAVGESVNQATDAGMQTQIWNENQGATSMLFNQNKPPFDNVKARQAVTLALDIDQMLDVVTLNTETRAASMFQESSPFYDAKYNFPKPDAVQAQKLFDELAAANGGQPLTFTMAVSTNTANKARVTQLQTQLLKYKNVKAELKVIDGPQYGTALFAGDFNMALYAIASPDPEPQFAQLSSTYYVKIADMKSAAGDAALLAGVQATDDAGRKVAYGNLQQALLDTYAEIWMYRNIVRAIYSPNTTGLVTYGQGSHLFDQYGLVE